MRVVFALPRLIVVLNWLWPLTLPLWVKTPAAIDFAPSDHPGNKRSLADVPTAYPPAATFSNRTD